MNRIIAVIATSLTVLTCACVPRANYEDPLKLIGRDISSLAASQYKNLTLGVIFNENTKKAIGILEDSRKLTAFLNPTANADLDSAYLTKSIDDILRQRFKDVRVLDHFDGYHNAGIDTVMVLDLQIQLGSHSGADTKVAIQGIFLDAEQSTIAQIKGEGLDTVPFPAYVMSFKPAAVKALQTFAQTLDGSSELAARLASPMNVSTKEKTTAPIPPIANHASPGNIDGRRVGLVIGNSHYRNVPRLANTATDARLVAETLKKVGFELIGGGALLDLDRIAFIKALTAFGDSLTGSAVGVFYYAGHGMQLQGANYLIPIEANPTRPSDADTQLVDAAVVLHQMEDSGASLKVIILDACRNNPFGGRGLRDASGGLAQMRAPEGTVISYATQPGNVALDGEAGGDSPYTLALAQSIVTPGLDVLSMFNDVGVQVDSSTNGSQQPWLASSPIKGKFYFGGR